MKKWYNSKLIWFGATELIAGTAKFFVDGDPTALAGAATGIITIILRLITKQPIG